MSDLAAIGKLPTFRNGRRDLKIGTETNERLVDEFKQPDR